MHANVILFIKPIHPHFKYGAIADLKEAISHFISALNLVTAPPLVRIRAGQFGVRLLQIQSRFIEAVALAKDVIDLLPIVDTRSLDRKDRQFILSAFSGIAADICSLLLKSRSQFRLFSIWREVEQ